MSADLILQNASLPDHSRDDLYDIVIREGKIFSIETASSKIPVDQSLVRTDLAGNYLFPGIVETHMHGSFSFDFQTIDQEGLNRFSLLLASYGVTSFFVSLLPEADEKFFERLSFYAKAVEKVLPAARLTGIHLEGPWISPDKKGAIAADYLLNDKAELLDLYQEAADGHISYITIAPELDIAESLIKRANKNGIVVGLGHSKASYESSCKIIKAGAGLVTHLGNAMLPVKSREPGLIAAALENDIYLELIIDLVHLHPGFLRLIRQTAGFERIIAVTDASMAAGMPDGDYFLGQNPINVKDKVAYLKDSNTLAGSTLDAQTAIRNAMTVFSASFQEVYPLFSANPARLYSLNTGEISPGKIADLTAYDCNFNLKASWVAGRQVFNACYNDDHSDKII